MNKKLSIKQIHSFTGLLGVPSENGSLKHVKDFPMLEPIDKDHAKVRYSGSCQETEFKAR